MMQAHELRIGNIFWEEYGGYKIVTAINCNKLGDAPNTVLARAITGTLSGQFDCDRIHPVSLSPEILIACGFQKDQDEIYMIPFQECGLYWLETKMQLAIGYIPIINFNCTSLHQLQNIYYYLTDGKELIYKP